MILGIVLLKHSPYLEGFSNNRFLIYPRCRGLFGSWIAGMFFLWILMNSLKSIFIFWIYFFFHICTCTLNWIENIEFIMRELLSKSLIFRYLSGAPTGVYSIQNSRITFKNWDVFIFRSRTVLLHWRFVQHYFRVFEHTSKPILSAIFETYLSSILVLSERVSTIFNFIHGKRFSLIAVYFIRIQYGLEHILIGRSNRYLFGFFRVRGWVMAAYKNFTKLTTF